MCRNHTLICVIFFACCCRQLTLCANTLNETILHAAYVPSIYMGRTSIWSSSMLKRAAYIIYACFYLTAAAV